MFATAILIGIAREMCEVFNRLITFASFEFVQTVTSAFLTYSEINVFVSRDFFISFEKIKSN